MWKSYFVHTKPCVLIKYLSIRSDQMIHLVQVWCGPLFFQLPRLSWVQSTIGNNVACPDDFTPPATVFVYCFLLLLCNYHYKCDKMWETRALMVIIKIQYKDIRILTIPFEHTVVAQKVFEIKVYSDQSTDTLYIIH